MPLTCATRRGASTVGCMAKASKTRTVGPCAHCGDVRTLFARGLCWEHVNDPAVLAKYEPAVRGARRGVGNGNRRKLPATPTPCFPGTEGKIAEMCRRARLGVSLFHPDDAVTPEKGGG